MDRCSVCENYLTGLKEPRCKFCNFEWAKELIKDDWDILNEDDSWVDEHSIRDRLWAKGIECLSADIWADDNIAIIYGYGGNQGRVADALGINKKCVYVDPLHDVTIINLLEEKFLRYNKDALDELENELLESDVDCKES